jgi:hypothetical protein
MNGADDGSALTCQLLRKPINITTKWPTGETEEEKNRKQHKKYSMDQHHFENSMTVPNLCGQKNES